MKVTQEMIVKMNDLYLEIKTYSGVARVVGVAPSTVKKYINPDYQKVEIKKKEIEEREINFDLFNGRNNWNVLLELMPREVNGMMDIRKEIVF